MPEPILQPSMSGGELSPSLYARVDMARYQISLKTCRNFISQVYGGVKNRPGTSLCAAAKFASTQCRLIPFVFNVDQAYVLELGNRYLRAFFRGAAVTGVTNKPNYGTINPVNVSGTTFTLTASMDTFVAGDVGRELQVWIAKGDIYTITVVTDARTATATSLADLSALTYSPTTSWMFVGNAVGAVVFETDTPWTDAELSDLVFTQSADVITAVHPSHAPQDIRRLADGTFQVVPTDIQNGPFMPVNIDKTTTIAADGTSGSVTLSASRPFFTESMVGTQLYLEQVAPADLWAPGVVVSGGDERLSDGKYYRAQAGGTTGNIAPVHYDGVQSDGKINWLYLHSGYGVAKITAVGSLTDGFSLTATALVNGVLPDGLASSSSTVSITAYDISPANPSWVRAESSGAHGFVSDELVTYTAS